MSRVLTEILGANEPAFRLGLRQLEESVGRPAHDIRLTLEIERDVRRKMAALGLDPANTSAEELYQVLKEKLRSDERDLRIALNLEESSPPTDVLKAVQAFVQAETADKQVFALKSAVLKTLLKKLKPKATMKALGYRSMDSMFKHESALQLLVATELVEDAAWNEARLQAYKKLVASNFELRNVVFEVPTTKKWPELAARFTDANHHNVVVCPELGGVMLLPLEKVFEGFGVLTVVLSFRAFEDVRSLSALLKLHQVEPNFNQVFCDALHHAPMTDYSLGSSPVSWQMVHWFYGSAAAPYHADIFEPHLLPEDLRLHDTTASLKKLNQSFEFWDGSHFLALFEEHQIVSLNILDVALALCNGFTNSSQMLYYMREALNRELLFRYLKHDVHHAALQDSLSRQLAPVLDFDES